jgi:hypothetical protein
MKFMKCFINRPDQSESTMLRCRPDNSTADSVWVQGNSCVAQNEEIELIRLNSVDELGWAFVRTGDNVEGFVRAEYICTSPAGRHNRCKESLHKLKNGKVERISTEPKRPSLRGTSEHNSTSIRQFFPRATLGIASADESIQHSSTATAVSKQQDHDTIRRSSRVRAPTKFLVKETGKPTLDNWLQKCELKQHHEAESAEEDIVDAAVTSIALEEDRPVGDYFMKLRVCVVAKPKFHRQLFLLLTVCIFKVPSARHCP